MPNRKLPPNEQVIEMYQGGMSSTEIAEVCGVASITVISLLRRLGVPRRTASEAARIRTEKGRNNPPRFWLGKKHPAEMVERRIAKIRGENHYLWKGGDSKRDYRKVVAKEECDQCGSADNLGIHHIDNDHYNNDPVNLRVLCVSCHMSLHKSEYWKAKHEGRATPRSNGPIGWKRKGG